MQTIMMDGGGQALRMPRTPSLAVFLEDMAPQMCNEVLNGDGGEDLLGVQAHIWNHLFNFISSMSLKCAVELQIPDIIHDYPKSPVTLSELVAALGIPETKSTHLYRLMRLLVHSGFFAIRKVHDTLEEGEEKEGYVLTPSSKLLLRNHTKSMSPFLLMVLDPAIVKTFHFLSEWFQVDEMITPFEARNGVPIFRYFGENGQVLGKMFDESMGCDAQLVMSVVSKKCKAKFEGLKSLVDVGGGIGTAAQVIAETFHGVKCTVLELPQVVGSLKGSANVEFVCGDMFEFIPSAHAVLLKWVMHNWSDEECVKILKHCKEAIPSKEEGGKVIIIDMVVNDSTNKGNYKLTETQLVFDLLIMNAHPGRERTEAEWEKLFLDAGFSSYNIAPVLGLRSLIEVFP